MAAFDPNVWSGRALQEDFVELAVAVLHQCIRPLIGVCRAPGHHGYQRACDLINGQASTGHLGHQCAHALGRPNLHLVSSSRRPRQETGIGATLLLAPDRCSSFVRAMRPFLRPGLRVFLYSRALFESCPWDMPKSRFFNGSADALGGRAL